MIINGFGCKRHAHARLRDAAAELGRSTAFMKATTFILSLLILACSTHRVAVLPLQPDEPAIIAAAIKDEVSRLDELMSRRPVIFVDATDKWFPRDRPETIPEGLPEANKHTYNLSGIQVPEGVVLYSASFFDKNYEYAKPSKAIVRQFGKEPFVLSVSRPFISADGKAHLLLHWLSTWSGCGGINVVHLAKVDSVWSVENWDLFLIW